MSSKGNDRLLPELHDVIIVGAGPCGLATAARLRERMPSALSTDEEYERYHWIRRHSDQASIKGHKSGAVRSENKADHAAQHESPRMLVLDSSRGCWIFQWKRLFADLDTTHLRSPMFFHSDTYDRNGLLAFAYAQGREHECVQVADLVSKKHSKHHVKKMRKKRNNSRMTRLRVTIDERDRKDYFAPSNSLFRTSAHGRLNDMAYAVMV